MSITSRAVQFQGSTSVSWRVIDRRPRGLPPGVGEAIPPEDIDAAPAGAHGVLNPRLLVGGSPEGGSRSTSGAFRLDLTTGETSAPAADTPEIGPAAAPMLVTPRVKEVAAEELLPGVEGDQFLSADGRHVMVSQPTGDDTEWERYTLAVYGRETKKRLGQFTSHLAVVPFFVSGSRVIFETGPFTPPSGTGKAGQAEPRKIRAVDLENGKELWSQPVRDLQFRGPLPP